MVEIPLTLDRDRVLSLKFLERVPRYTLRVRVLADSAEVPISAMVAHPEQDIKRVKVDTTLLTTDRLELGSGAYTITAPGDIVVDGVTYRYSTYEVV